MTMMQGTWRGLAALAGLAAIWNWSGREAWAIDVYWTSAATGSYNTGANWSSGFVPEAGGGNNERAVIGTTTVPGVASGVATLAATPVAAGGLVLGLEPGTTGALTITSGTLANVTTAQAGVGADGRVFVGGGGRGYLTMTGGTLNALGLTVGGENVTTGNGTSLLDVSGASTVNITGSTGVLGLTNISRRLKVTGPSVNFTTQRNLRLESTASYTAGITAATHSKLVTNGNAVLGGTLAVQFSGAGATHSPGATWDLIDSAGTISGSFSNVPSGSDVPVTGLAAPAPLGSAYRLRTVPGAGTRSLLQLSLDKVLVLRVNRDTGELSIRNPLGGAISIDSYQVASARGSLLAGYKGISGTPAADANWFKFGASSTFLGEVKNDGTRNSVFNLTSVPSATLGTGFSKTAVGGSLANFGLDGEDLVFDYSGPDGDIIHGQVEYIGTKFENDLVLRVNPNSGQAFLKNDSLLTLKFDGYSILSSTGALSGGGWTGIGGAWQKSSPATNAALTETNPTGMITLAPGAQQAIGTIGAFASSAAQNGLSFQFILAEGFEGGGGAGDLTGDAFVDGADFLAWQRGLGTTYAAPDLTPIVTNFGTAGGGAPPETTFRTGSVVFDATAGVSAAAAIPEPSGAALALLGSALAASRRGWRRRRRTINGIDETQRNSASAQAGRGANTMSKRVGAGVVAMFGAAAMLTGGQAVAVTQGITLINGRFELPGPAGTKVVAFDGSGAPIPGIIPGWTFVGPGQELFGDNVLGDSGTEGGGNPGNEMLLSTQDGVVYQTSSFNVVSIPATQQYRLSFDAHNIFTIDGSAQLTARLYYDNAGVRTTIGTPLVISDLAGFVNHEITIPGGSPLLTPALGKPIGVEFDTTSTEANPAVVNSWAGVDNVLLQISGVLDGDFNGDGSITLADYTVLRDNLQEPHDFLADGDVTSDGIVDLNDFRAWKTLSSVVASGVLQSIGVPEPSGLALLAVGLLGWSASRRRRLRGVVGRRGATLALAGGVAAALLLGAPSRTEATLLYYDPFTIGANPAAGQYTLGPLVGQNPTLGPTPFFTGAWETRAGDQAPNNNVISPGISFLGAPAAGGAVQPVINAEMTSANARAGRYLATPIDSTTVGTYYISFVANFGSLPAGSVPSPSDFGHRAVEFWQAGGVVGTDANLSLTLGYMGYNGGAGAANQISSTARMRALIAGGGDQVIENSPFSFNLDGATHLVVVKMQMTTDPVAGGIGGDTVSIYLDPTSVTEPDLPGATATGLDFSLGSMSASIFFGPPVGTMPIIDEIRVADTWASVVPEFPLPGDTDGDRDVDLVDYANITSHFGQSVTSALDGDVALANGRQGSDGRVTIADYRIWRDNRTDVAAGPAGFPTPEPTSLTLLGTACATLWRRRR